MTDYPIPDGVDDPGRLVNNQQAVETLQRAIIAAPRDLNIFRMSLKEVLKDGAWLDRYDPHRQKRYRALDFVRFISEQSPEGLGTDVDTILALANDDEELLTLLDGVLKRGDGNPTGANRKAAPVRQDVFGTVSNIHSSSDTLSLPSRPAGTTAAAGRRRLAKDRPDLLARVVADELSVNAAMIEAGFRHAPTPLEILRRAWGKATPEERKTFLTEVNHQ